MRATPKVAAANSPQKFTSWPMELTNWPVMLGHNSWNRGTTEGSPIYTDSKRTFDKHHSTTNVLTPKTCKITNNNVWKMLVIKSGFLIFVACTLCETVPYGDAVKIQHIQDSAFCWSRVASTIQLMVFFIVGRIVPSSLLISKMMWANLKLTSWCGKLTFETNVFFSFTPLKTNMSPWKINGWFRCISYWNSPF